MGVEEYKDHSDDDGGGGEGDQGANGMPIPLINVTGCILSAGCIQVAWRARKVASFVVESPLVILL